VLERYEALTARSSRLQDLLIRPFKTLAVIELEEDKAERIPDLRIPAPHPPSSRHLPTHSHPRHPHRHPHFAPVIPATLTVIPATSTVIPA
jgi:hypothetical protein